MAIQMKLDERQTDEEILAQYPSQKMKAAVEEKRSHQNNSANILRFDLGKSTVSRIVAVAAVLALTVLLPVTYSRYRSQSAQEAYDVRAKGNGKSDVPVKKISAKQELFVYRDEHGSAVKLSNGSSVQQGDVIQLSYVVPYAAYGMILSIDGNGAITQHFPETPGKAALLSVGTGEIALDAAYKLDDAPYYERFVFITSGKMFTSDSLELAVSTMKLKQAKKNNFKSYLPPDAQVTSLLLVKKVHQ